MNSLTKNKIQVKNPGLLAMYSNRQWRESGGCDAKPVRDLMRDLEGVKRDEHRGEL